MPLDFGIEIECLLPGQSGFLRRVGEGVARDLTELGVGCAFEGYNHQMRSNWKIVTDASISAPTGYVGLEIVSPPMDDMRVPEIDIVCRKLNELGARTNRSCGLHVHIGARLMPIEAMKRLAFLYIENEDVIDGLMPPSRRADANSRYCGSVKTGMDLARIQRAQNVRDLSYGIKNGSRFVKLNFTSHWKHGTVEFRQHSGTVDPEKIKRWVYFCQKLVDVAIADTTIRPPSTAPAGPSPELQRRLMKIKVAALIYELACRPQGVTPSEARQALGWTNTPRPSIDLNRLGVDWYTEGFRQRQKVYKIRQTAGTIPTLNTLASLLEKLGMEEEHSRFWNERVRVLGTAAGCEAMGNENPNPLYRTPDVRFTQHGVVTGRMSSSGEGGHYTEAERAADDATGGARLSDILEQAMRDRREP